MIHFVVDMDVKTKNVELVQASDCNTKLGNIMLPNLMIIALNVGQYLVL